MLKLVAALAGLLLVHAGPAIAASGLALGVDPDARAETGAEVRVLRVGADIAIGDRVITDDRGLVQIKFSDSTELVIGPRSSLVIEDYLLRADGSAGKVVVNALAGTFRFVTGSAPKDRYLFRTPSGTVGVRGTAFDLNVAGPLSSLLLFHGAVQLCTLAGACVTVDEACEVGQFDTASSVVVGHTDDITGPARETLRALFPYANSQAPLLGAFRVDNARRCLNRPPDVPRSEPERESDDEPDQTPNNIIKIP